MGTIIAIVAIVAVFALALIFILGAGRVSARAEQRNYVNRVLRNVEARGEFDYIERNLYS